MRNRVDLGWVAGDPNHRYRNQLKLEWTFDAGRFQFTPYAHAEVFYDFKGGRWTRFRYAAGAEWYITKRFVLEGYYLRQNTWRQVPQFVNGLGAVFKVYLRLTDRVLVAGWCRNLNESRSAGAVCFGVPDRSATEVLNITDRHDA